MHRTVLVLGDPLVLRQSRLADRLLARLFGASLDRELAGGRSPEASRLLAARAQDIVSPRKRQALACNWGHLLAAAYRPRSRRVPAVPVRGDRITAAEPAIRELMRRLSTPAPVPARGVAMASVLLTDGTGPVYRGHASGVLAAAVDAALAQLDPAAPLMA